MSDKRQDERKFVDAKDLIAEYDREFADDPDYVWECIYYDVVDQVLRRLDELEMSQRDLAERLGITEAAVSRMLGSRQNLTFRSVARLAVALECDLTAPQLCGRGPAPGEHRNTPQGTFGRKRRSVRAPKTADVPG